MPTISEIRSQYPQYNDMSDADLAGALHKKFYSDMPREQFDAKIGIGGAPETPVPMGKPLSPVQQMLGGMENLLPSAEQGTNPNVEAYKGSNYLGPATIGEGDEVFYKDAQGRPVPTDKNKHVVIRDPRDGQVKVFARTDDTSEGGLVGAARVLAPGLATGPLARTPGALRAAETAVPRAAEDVIQAATPGRATREELGQAAGRLQEYGQPVDLPRFIASDRMPIQQLGVQGRHLPIFGDPIIKQTEETLQQLGKATAGVAENLGGASMEGAGQLAKGRLLDYIGPKSEAVVDKAYDAVDAAINPSIRSTLDETAKTVADITARRQNAAITAPSKAADLVSTAIKTPGDTQLAELTAQLGGTPKAAEMAAKALGSGPEAAGLNYQGIKDLRSYIGRQLKQSILPEGMDAGELKQIYGSLTKDLGTAAEKAGGTSGRALFQRANDFYKEVAQRRKDLADIVGLKGDASPAQVFDRITKAAGSNSRADIDLLMKAKHAIGEDWDQVASAATSKFGLNAKGIWQPEIFLNNWQKFSPAGKSALYGTSAHRQALEDIAMYSTRWPQLQKFQNTSGTVRIGIGGAGVGTFILSPLKVLATVFDPSFIGGAAAAYMGSRALAKPIKPILSEALAKPATAASVSAWSRAYERLVRSASPGAMAQFTLQSRNLANTLNSQLGTQVSPTDFLKAVQGNKRDATPQRAGPQLPFRQGEQMDNLMASVNGPQGYPDFHWVNPAGVDAFLARAPMSSNIEDRRREADSYDAQAAQVRRRAGRQ